MGRGESSRVVGGTQQRARFAAAEVRRPAGRYDYVLLLAVAGLLILGLMMVYSATFDWVYQEQGSLFAKAAWQLLWVAVGIVALVVCARIPYDWWQRMAVPIMGVTLLLLIAVLVIGMRGGQSEFRRNIWGGSIQPSEAAKLGLIIYVAAWLASKGERIRDLTYGLVPFAVLVGVLAGLLIAQPDLSAAISAILVAVIMFFFAGADIVQLAISVLMGGAALLLFVNQVGYARQRVQEWILLWRSPEQLGWMGWHNQQALMALGSGGVFGLGLGQGLQKMGYLPAPHTDSIFAVIGQELGLVGCLVVLGLYALITYRGFRIALTANDTFAALLACGLTSSIAVQALLNIGVVTGLIPFTGVALPFISFGGSAMVSSLASVGLLLSISRGKRIGRRSEHGGLQPADLDRRWWHGGPRLSRPRRRFRADRR